MEGFVYEASATEVTIVTLDELEILVLLSIYYIGEGTRTCGGVGGGGT